METTVLQPPVGPDHPLLDQFQRSSQGARSKVQAFIGSSLPSEGSLCACHHRGDSPGGRGCRPSRRLSYNSPSGSFGHSSRQGSDTPPLKRRLLSGDSSTDGRFTAAAAGPSVSWRQPFAFAPDQPSSNSSGRSFHQGGHISPPPPPLIRCLGYQSSFCLMMSANPLWFSYYRTK